MTTRNQERPLVYSGPHLTATSLTNVRDFPIGSRTIVVNPTQAFVTIAEQPRSILPPLSSTILQGTTIAAADALLLFQFVKPVNLGDIIFESGWALYWDLIKDTYRPAPGGMAFPPNTPLWRSPVDDLGRHDLDPFWASGDFSNPRSMSPYVLRTELWFAPAGTSCFIHNTHDFVEVHTQIVGNGRMQKFETQDFATCYEEILMSPGYTTPIAFCQIHDVSTFTYPWHQYYADTDCIWLALEYHPAPAATR